MRTPLTSAEPDRGVDLKREKQGKEKISNEEGRRPQNASNMAVKAKETLLNLGAARKYLFYIHFIFRVIPVSSENKSIMSYLPMSVLASPRIASSCSSLAEMPGDPFYVSVIMELPHAGRPRRQGFAQPSRSVSPTLCELPRPRPVPGPWLTLVLLA